MLTLQRGRKVLAAGTDVSARQKISDDYSAEWSPLYEKFLKVRQALTTAARELLVHIMGVEDLYN
jgi:hypothetical protein